VRNGALNVGLMKTFNYKHRLMHAVYNIKTYNSVQQTVFRGTQVFLQK